MLSRAEIKTLSEFLARTERPDGTLRFHELQGFLFAVACSPELIPPSAWFPIISGEKDIGFRDEKQAQQIMGLIMTLYNAINDAAFERSRKMPTGCRFRPDVEANFDDERPISLWSCGFTIGHDWLSEVWEEYVPDDIDGELASTAMVLSFFASRDLAKAYYLDATTSPRKRKPRVPFVEFAETVRKLFPDALASYAQVGRGISEILIELEASGR
jgi:yecA family protein